MTPNGVAEAISRRRELTLESLGEWLASLNRFLRPADGWLAVALLALNLMVVVWSVEKADWVPTPNLVYLILLAMLTGLVLSRVRLWAFLVLPVGLGIGLWVILWQLTSFREGDMVLAGTGELWGRLALWFQAAKSGNISLDKVPFAFGVMAVAWLAGYLAAWVFFRYQNFWAVFILGGAGLLSNLTYLPASASADLGLYLFTALLLVGRVQAVRRLQQWERRNVQTDSHLGLLALSDSVLLSFVVLLVAFLVPVGRLLGPTNLAYEAMRTPLQSYEDDFNRLFAGLPARRPLPYRIWGDVMAFQGTINPTTTRVLQVNSPVPMYWKARTYGTYTAEGWVSEGTVFKPLGWVPTYASPQQYQSRTQVSYSVLPKYATKSLFAGDQTVGADRPVQIETYDSPVYTLDLAEPASFRQLPPRLALAAENLYRVAQGSSPGAVSDRALEGSLPQEFRLVKVTRVQDRVREVTVTEAVPEPPDVLSTRSIRGRIEAQQTYQLTSLVSYAAPEELRRSGTDYPTWALVKYTQLPDDLPQRVRNLALQLTAQARTPYDMAKAIEGHLSTWHYTLQVEPPPYNADGVDHFLSTKAGYSEYFGSAMAVMLRTVGIPARLATGYATGDKVADQDIYLVTDSHSHAWVEIFFPGYGWIPFEPTPGKSLPAVPVPGSESLADVAGAEGQRADDCAEDLEACEEFGLGATLLDAGSGDVLTGIEKLLRLLLWLLPALGLGLLLVVGGWLFWRRYMMLPTNPQVAFQRLALLGGLSAAGPLAYQTPFQYRERLEQALPDQSNQVSAIVDSYVRTVYGRKVLTHEEQGRLSSSWLALRVPLLLRVLRRRNP